MCSVPTKLWLNRSASLRAKASTCWARGVKLLRFSSLIISLRCGSASAIQFANRLKNALSEAVCPVALLAEAE